MEIGCLALLGGSEGVLAQAADGADPILRDILPGCAGSDTAFGISDFRIIDIAAGTFVLHGDTILSVFSSIGEGTPVNLSYAKAFCSSRGTGVSVKYFREN
jgi:hypothetical protein